MTTMQPPMCLRGQPWPLGATPMTWQGQQGVNLAVFARHATAVHWCLFDADTSAETGRVRLAHCTDGVWHGFVPGMPAGQRSVPAGGRPPLQSCEAADRSVCP